MKLLEAKNLTTKLMKEFNVPSNWRFRFINTKRACGRCDYVRQTVELSESFVENNTVAVVENTIRHEIAHVLVGRGHGHGSVWKRMAVRCGAEPKATTSEAVQSKGKYTLKFNDEVLQEFYRRPKWSRNVEGISIQGRPETLGKLTLVQNY